MFGHYKIVFLYIILLIFLPGELREGVDEKTSSFLHLSWGPGILLGLPVDIRISVDDALKSELPWIFERLSRGVSLKGTLRMHQCGKKGISHLYGVLENI